MRPICELVSCAAPGSRSSSRRSHFRFSILLEKPGDLVTRDQLRERLWPSDTFVDFDHGLNTAVNKLREVLGDSASNPRFIETLPRRGYRFISDVRQISPVALQPPPAITQLEPT